jgi:hypothetical protein
MLQMAAADGFVGATCDDMTCGDGVAVDRLSVNRDDIETLMSTADVSRTS